MEVLEALQQSAFSTWVRGADTVWAYPTILTLHTVGLAILVGAALIIDLRLLGIGTAVPLASVRRLYRYVWVGFLINLTSGTVLFVTDAADLVTKPVFLIKLVFIAVGFTLALAVERRGFDNREQRSSVRVMAGLSLACWLGAITAGRLMAYL